MIPIKQYILIRCPALAASPNQDAYIAMASNRIVDGMGESMNEARALCAMHLFTTDGSGTGNTQNTGGRVKSMTEATLSVTFDTGDSGSTSIDKQFSEYASTHYGRDLIGLIKGSVFAPRTSMME